ncbi:MAG: hypothetical protein ACI9UJ_000557 [bacterium]|jgi:hypothetical protein
MKEQKDMDWELFEMLEGELTPEQEAALLNKIDGDKTLSSDWDFMQMTTLDAPEVVYNGKQNLIKKDTTLIVFSSVQWRRIVSVAALLALCYPVWQFLMPKTNNLEGLAGSATEIVNPSSDVEGSIIGDDMASSKEAIDVTDDTPVVKVKREAIVQQYQKIAKPEVDEIPAVQPSPAIVSIEPSNMSIALSPTNNEPALLPKARHRYSMASLLPKDEKKTYKGIRPTINAGLAALTSPLRNAKIKVRPTDNKTIQIVYSSLQYNASAMVSLKPLK